MGDPEKMTSESDAKAIADATAQGIAELAKLIAAEDDKQKKRRAASQQQPKATVTVLGARKPAKTGKPIDDEPTPGISLDELLKDVGGEESKGGADEEEALKAEPAPPKTDIGNEELKRRRIIRWLKLKQINARCAVIRSFGGKCAVVIEGRSRNDPNKKVFDFQTKQAFEQWMANEFIPSLEKEKENDAVGPWWWRHRKRRQYDGVVFKPLAKEEVKAPGGQKLLNMWLGWGVEEKKGDWALIREHIKLVLANNDAEAYEYIIRWIAWAVQHPDRPAEVALVFIGEKGTGKGTLGRVLAKIFGYHSFKASSLEHVVGKFNAHKENCILFIADEAYWGGHKSATGELQRMITEATLPIERKYFDVYEALNYIHMLMLGEPGWVLPAGRFERRYAAFEPSEAKMGDFDYFKALHAEIDGDGPAAMLYDLRRMNLKDWHPRQVYKTAALRRRPPRGMA
jgi:hypothetical protein